MTPELPKPASPPRHRPLQRWEIEAAEARRRDRVERRILEAMDAGEFDNLPGSGLPLCLEQPTPGHEDLWWALKILRQAHFVPDEIRYRRLIDELRERLATVRTESEVRTLVQTLNDLVRNLNTMGTNRIPTTCIRLDEEQEVARFRQRTTG